MQTEKESGWPHLVERALVPAACVVDPREYVARRARVRREAGAGAVVRAVPVAVALAVRRARGGPVRVRARGVLVHEIEEAELLYGGGGILILGLDQPPRAIPAHQTIRLISPRKELCKLVGHIPGRLAAGYEVHHEPNALESQPVVVVRHQPSHPRVAMRRDGQIVPRSVAFSARSRLVRDQRKAARVGEVEVRRHLVSGNARRARVRRHHGVEIRLRHRRIVAIEIRPQRDRVDVVPRRSHRAPPAVRFAVHRLPQIRNLARAVHVPTQPAEARGVAHGAGELPPGETGMPHLVRELHVHLHVGAQVGAHQRRELRHEVVCCVVRHAEPGRRARPIGQ
eukprot:1195711-Prorocentrum_minimum.AAC.9